MSALFRAALVVALVSLLTGCRREDGEQVPSPEKSPVAVLARLKKPAAPVGRFAGSSVCAECHAEIAAKYALHPMGMSLQRVLDKPLENYDAAEFSPIPARKYHVEKQGNRVLHREAGFAADGQPLYDQAVEISYALGSGRRGRSYIIDREGLLFISPISWYASSDRWDLAPQYEALGSLRFERPAYERCLHCHAGAMNYDRLPKSELAVRYRQPPFKEMSIGCERCHGPGEKHVAERRAMRDAPAASKKEADDSIVNPNRLAATRRDAVCNQCHLHGEAMILRYGRTHADFRPGDALGDVWSCFVEGGSQGAAGNGAGIDAGIGDDNRTRAVSQGEQMIASACYQRSAGRLGCVSCHDPHEIPEEDKKAAWFNARCDTCHQKRGCSLPADERRAAPASGSCIACHMPALDASDVPHTTQTDHRIPRRAGKALSTVNPSGEATDPANLVIFDERDCPLPPIEASRARGLMLAQAAEFSRDASLAKRAEELLQDVRAAAPDDVDTLDALAVCASLDGRRREAAQLWRSAATIDPRRQSVLFSLASVAQGEGNLPTAQVYEERLLKLNPWQASYHLRHARSLAGLGNFEGARESAERAHELDPSSAETCLLLAQIMQKLGKADAAESFKAKASLLSKPSTGDRPPNDPAAGRTPRNE